MQWPIGSNKDIVWTTVKFKWTDSSHPNITVQSTCVISGLTECSFFCGSIDGKKFRLTEDDFNMLSKDCAKLRGLQLPACEIEFTESIGEGL